MPTCWRSSRPESGAIPRSNVCRQTHGSDARPTGPEPDRFKHQPSEGFYDILVKPPPCRLRARRSTARVSRGPRWPAPPRRPAYRNRPRSRSSTTALSRSMASISSTAKPDPPMRRLCCCCTGFRPRLNVPQPDPGARGSLPCDRAGLSGFGESAAPDHKTFAYTFGHYADIVDGLLTQLGVKDYAIYLMDYGAPVGYRLASSIPTASPPSSCRTATPMRRGSRRSGIRSRPIGQTGRTPIAQRSESSSRRKRRSSSTRMASPTSQGSIRIIGDTTSRCSTARATRTSS